MSSTLYEYDAHNKLTKRDPSTYQESAVYVLSTTLLYFYNVKHLPFADVASPPNFTGVVRSLSISGQ